MRRTEWNEPTLSDVFHFTHVGNLDSMLRRGAICCHRDAGCAHDIADADIKSRRQRISVPIAPRGMVGDYVPFYFAPRSPMLFRLQKEGIAASDLIYLVSSASVIIGAGQAVVVSDGNAASGLTEFHPVDRMSEVVDWPLMGATMWANTDEDPDRKRRRQAEFLVHSQMPLTLVSCLGVYNEAVRSQVEEALHRAGVALSVKVTPMWYFAT